MSLKKNCADHLRAFYRQSTGKKLSAGHAHELVAAYFGYSTGSALRAEPRYPLAALEEAEFLLPDLRLMDRRVLEIDALPADTPSIQTVVATPERRRLRWVSSDADRSGRDVRH